MRTVIVLGLLSLMSGCMTHDPYTGEELVSKAIIGAAIGATVGAIGGGVGYYTDRQEAKLRQELANTGVQVVRDGDNLILVMPVNITFPT